jgi:hypothetical protein
MPIGTIRAGDGAAQNRARRRNNREKPIRGESSPGFSPYDAQLRRPRRRLVRREDAEMLVAGRPEKGWKAARTGKSRRSVWTTDFRNSSRGVDTVNRRIARSPVLVRQIGEHADSSPKSRIPLQIATVFVVAFFVNNRQMRSACRFRLTGWGLEGWRRRETRHPAALWKSGAGTSPPPFFPTISSARWEPVPFFNGLL